MGDVHMNSYIDACKQHIIDTLSDYQDITLEACDLGMTLTEGENANGSWYCSTYKAEQDLDSFGRDIVRDFIDEYKDEFGEKPQWDAYTDPENFHCLMMIMGVEKLINQLLTINNHWNKKITLDKETIKKLIDELENVKE